MGTGAGAENIDNAVIVDDDPLKQLKAAAQQGDAQAQDNLTNCYDDGEIVDQNATKAFEWWQKAANNGNADAQNKLGDYYYYKSKSGDSAIYWYRKAADNGNESAKQELQQLVQ